MAWTNTRVSQYVVADRRVHVYDCVYGGTGYGGGLSASTGATGATGPTRNDLGFADVADPEFSVLIAEKDNTSPVTRRNALYDLTNQRLVVGATAGTDISGVTYRVIATGRYGR